MRANGDTSRRTTGHSDMVAGGTVHDNDDRLAGLSFRSGNREEELVRSNGDQGRVIANVPVYVV